MAESKNDGDEDLLDMEGYRESTPRVVLSWIGVILSLGLLRLLFYLYPVLHLKATHSKTTLLYAQNILVTDIYEKRRTQYLTSVKILDLNSIRLSYQSIKYKDSNESSRFVDEQFEAIFQNRAVVYFTDGNYQVLGDRLRVIIIKKLPYIWNEESKRFRRIIGIGPGLNYYDLHHYSQNNEIHREIMRAAYGNNTLEVPDDSFFAVLIKETFSPFYMLQFVNSLLWGITGDWIYAGILIFFTFIIIILTSAQTKWNQKMLKKTLKTELMSFNVLSRDDILTVPSTKLVPGDRIVLPYNGCKVPCDGIVLSGSCIVNESMLTGESVPQTKTPLPMTEMDYIESDTGNHNLYNGTDMIKSLSSEPVTLLVTRTGFSTKHGSIVRAILYPRPLDYAFENSVVFFAIGLFSLSIIGAIINDIIQINNKESAWVIIVNTLKIGILLIPPIMPILTAAKLISIRRLIRRHIFCINPAAFNLAGYVTCTCFDKTGTLTEDGLDMHEVVPSHSSIFSRPISGDTKQTSDNATAICKAMACCHSLVLIDNTIIGDPIDVKMFEWTDWKLIPANKERQFSSVSPGSDSSLSIDILHQSQFTSKLQRMSVVVREPDISYRLYCKGSPEIIKSLSLPQTVPVNFEQTLESYTKRGFRVLAVGTRILEVNNLDDLQKSKREDLESRLEFLGLMVFENKLKPETIPTLKEIRDANYKIIMITGDNQQTAESVAKECGIVSYNQTLIELSEVDDLLKCSISKSSSKMSSNNMTAELGGIEDYAFSISGKAWRILKAIHSDILPKILVKSAVFARMSPDQKKEVIVELTNLGYGIVMCGDGANDCGALRAADVGIALTKSESSAAASFTTHIADISCVPHVIRYGRCSLASSVSFFKYMMMNSALSAIVERFMQGMNSNLSSGENVYLTFICNVNVSIFFSRSDAYQGPLPPHLPMNSVLTFPVVFSIVTNLCLFFGIQVSNYFLVRLFSWYTHPTKETSYESYAMFCTMAFQTVILAVSQSSGYPFRLPVYKNRLLAITLTAIIILNFIVTLHPTKALTDWLVIPFPPKLDFPFTLLAVLFCNLVLAVLLEYFLIEKVIYKRCKRYPYLIKTKTKQKYLDIEENMQGGYTWVTDVFHCNQRQENGFSNNE